VYRYGPKRTVFDHGAHFRPRKHNKRKELAVFFYSATRMHRANRDPKDIATPAGMVLCKQSRKKYFTDSNRNDQQLSVQYPVQ